METDTHSDLVLESIMIHLSYSENIYKNILVNTFLASGNFCCLLINFTENIDEYIGQLFSRFSLGATFVVC